MKLKIFLISLLAVFIFLGCSSSSDDKKVEPAKAAIVLSTYQVIWGGNYPVLRGNFIMTNTGGGTLSGCTFTVYVRVDQGYKISENLRFSISGLALPTGQSTTVTLNSTNQMPGNYDYTLGTFRYYSQILEIYLNPDSVVIL